MSSRMYRISAGASLLMSLAGLFSPEKIFGGDFTVEKLSPLTLTLDSNNDRSDNIVQCDTATIHDNISFSRLNGQSIKLGLEADTVSLGPDNGDNPAVTLYNESWHEERCYLKAEKMEVGANGGWGSVDMAGGSLQVKNLYICENANVPEDNTLLTLRRKNVQGKLFLNRLFNNAKVGVKISFDGGAIKPTYGASTKLFNPVSGDIILSAVAGNSINIVNEMQYSEFFLVDPYSAYAGKLKTEGEGDFVVDGEFKMNNKYALADQLVLYISEKVKSSVVWGHKGDFVLKHSSVLFSAADSAPANADTGMIRLSCKDPEHPSVFNMGEYDQTVNGIVVAEGEYGKVIAQKGITLTLGRYKDGELTNVDLGNEVKIVQEGHTISFACESVSAYEVKAGMLKITRSTEIGNLELASGVTVDVAEGVVLQVGTLTDDGAVFTGKGSIAVTEGGAYLNKAHDLKTIKSGTGTFVYNQKAPIGDVYVLEGTLKLAGIGSTNEWWRVIVNESGWRLNIAAIGLFADSTLDSVLDGYTYSQATDSSSIANGQIYYDTKTYNCVTTSGNGVETNPTVTFTNDASVLLNSDWASAMVFDKGGNTPKDIAFTFRRADRDKVPVTSFSVRYPINGVDTAHKYQARSANKYVIETSVDGNNWIEVGSVDGRGEGTWGSWTDNRSFPMALPAGVPVSGGLGLAEGAAVRVASGATLDLLDCAENNLISKLVVDATGDNGTILGSSLAAEGIVVIKNFKGKESLKSARLLSFPGMTVNLSNWRVQDESGKALLVAFAVRDGEMVVEDRGLVITVQ